MTNEPEGILTIRVWLEPDSAEPVRARIRTTVGFPPSDENVELVAGADAITDAVKAWLQEIFNTTGQ